MHVLRTIQLVTRLHLVVVYDDDDEGSIDLKVKTEFNVPPSFPDCYLFCMQRAFCT